MKWKRRKTSPLKDFAFGLAGGAGGTAAMGFYFKAITKLIKKHPLEPSQETKSGPLDNISVVGKQYRPGETSTAAAGRILYTEIKGEEPPPEKAKTTLSNGVHWTYGTLQGGLYSLWKRTTKIPEGVAVLEYGTGMWLGSEFGAPALGLAKGPTAFSPAQHAGSLSAHWVYAMTACEIRRLLRNISNGVIV